MSIRDIMSGNLSAYTPARVQVTDDAAGLAVREITRAEIKSLDSAAQTAPVALEQTTGGIVNTQDTGGMAANLPDIMGQAKEAMSFSTGHLSAMQNLFGTSINIPDIRSGIPGMHSQAALTEIDAVNTDLSVASQRFQTSAQLSMNSALANAKAVSALLKNSG